MSFSGKLPEEMVINKILGDGIETQAQNLSPTKAAVASYSRGIFWPNQNPNQAN